jgi:iron complex outermembrane recepter protein
MISLKSSRVRASVLVTLSLSAIPVSAQSAEVEAADGAIEARTQATAEVEAVVVTARRVEERQQDVPISMTVFSQEELVNRNIFSSKDLAAFTPSMTVSTRYGSDTPSFTIRGFSQEVRTTASVATYFADVVGPRGGASAPGGDGVGIGSYFDLHNVQVLKGPQGTLFGRNTTGGAVLLVPRKPTQEFESYVEASSGNLDMRRFQGVVNIPLGETVRVRAGVDWQERDGFLRNVSGIGPDRMADVDYFAARVSMVADLTPTVENYTIASYSDSSNRGLTPKVTTCFPNVATYGQLSCDQVAREAGQGFWSVSNSMADPRTRVEQSQLINTTTWKANDHLTVKNIASYAELTSSVRIDAFGTDWIIPPVLAGRPTGIYNGTHLTFTTFSPVPTTDRTNDQYTVSEEFQLQGSSADERLVWQGGVYFEQSKPMGDTGVQNASSIPCTDLANFLCTDVLGILANTQGRVGSVSRSVTRTNYRDVAAYTQASYELTEQLKLTAGFRYTWDKVWGSAFKQVIRFPQPNSPVLYCNDPSLGFPTGPLGNNFSNGLPLSQLDTACLRNDTKSTQAPTWLLGLDYKPIEDVLLYAKSARGYRQGNIAPLSADGYNSYDAEKLDTYEIGAKVSWHGRLPGSFNMAGFYNDFRDQQLSVGFRSSTNAAPVTVGIVNAGKSRIAGIEADATISPVDGLQLNVGYAYLDSKLEEYTPPELNPMSPYDTVDPAVTGRELPFAIREKWVVGANYTLPLPESVGQIDFGGTYTKQSSYLIAYTANGGMPGHELLSFNLNWSGIAGSLVDASLFLTNATNEEYFVHVSDQASRGFVAHNLGEPRMYGVRLRYSFGP